jgi:glycosyltransferase involved in cell wall biosynthesis
MLLSIIIPCFNERATIANVIERVLACPHPRKEIVIVDDGSTDGSGEVLRPLAEAHGLMLITHEVNQGKGAAIRTGVAQATGDVMIVQDADLEYDPQEIPRVIAPILDGRADVVYGSRFSGGEAHRVLYFWHRVGNGLLTLLSNMLTDLNLTDMETCYKAFRSDIIKKLTIEESRFGFEPEITCKVARIPHVRIYEVGVSYSGRTYAEGKKIGVRDGFRAIYCLFKYRFARS